MVIYCHFFDVVIAEEIVPLVHIVPERVMENEICLRRIFLDHLSNLSIEILEDVEISVPPWLVNWLKSSKGTVVTPSLEETLGNVEGPLEVCVVSVFHLAINPWSHPISVVVWPVSEVIASLIPCKRGCFSTIVKSILRIFHCVDI